MMKPFVLPASLFVSLFFVMLGLCCCGCFSSCDEQALLQWLLSMGTMDLREPRLQEPQHLGSVVVAPSLWSTGSIAVAHGLSCSTACGSLPRAGIKPAPPTLAGGFFARATREVQRCSSRLSLPGDGEHKSLATFCLAPKVVKAGSPQDKTGPVTTSDVRGALQTSPISLPGRMLYPLLGTMQ